MTSRAPAKPGSNDPADAQQALQEQDARKLRIPIKKGHVRRGTRLADSVYAGARDNLDGDVEQGIVLMTAVLLVERMAAAAGCPPITVLQKMADCFELKQAYAKTLKPGMPS